MTNITRIISDDLNNYFEGCFSIKGERSLWESFRFYGKDSALFYLEDVYLETSTGLVLNNDFKIIKDVADDYLFWNPKCIWFDFRYQSLPWDEKQRAESLGNRLSIAQEKVDLIVFNNKENISKLTYPTIHLLSSRGLYTFGHIYDALQRILSFHEFNFEEKDYTYLLSPYEKIIDFEIQLRSFGIDPSKSVVAKNIGKIIHCDKLFYPISPCYYTRNSLKVYDDYILGSLYREAVKYLPEYCKGNNDNFKLYLSRNHIEPGKRDVINEHGLFESYLKPKGFIKVTGEESLPELIYMFSKAKVVIGTHGSLLVNTIFCPADAVIYEFYCSNWLDVSFKDKLKRCKNYHHISMSPNISFNISSYEIIEKLRNEKIG